MAITWPIRLKALLMLVAFAANLTVFCHCATAQAKKHSCCCHDEKQSKPCNSAQAVKFNLVEKQLADHIEAAPLPIVQLFVQHPILQPAESPAPITPNLI